MIFIARREHIVGFVIMGLLSTGAVLFMIRYFDSSKGVIIGVIILVLPLLFVSNLLGLGVLKAWDILSGEDRDVEQSEWYINRGRKKYEVMNSYPADSNDLRIEVNGFTNDRVELLMEAVFSKDTGDIAIHRYCQSLPDHIAALFNKAVENELKREGVYAKDDVEVGVVRRYHDKTRVGAIQITNGELRVGDTIHIKGHATDYITTVRSMQIEHEAVQKAEKGGSAGIQFGERVHRDDRVFKVMRMERS